MPTFQDLLAQLSLEHERVQQALAAALRELPARRGQDVGAGTFASRIPSCPTPPCQTIRSPSSPRTTVERERGARDGGEWRPEQFQVFVDEEAPGEVCERGRSLWREPTPLKLEKGLSMEPALEEDRDLAVCRGATANACLPCPASASEGPIGISDSEHALYASQSARRPHYATAPTSQPCSNKLSASFSDVIENPRRRWSIYMRDTSSIIGRRRSIREFQIAGSWWVVNPENSPALQKWDQITLIALAYVALATPVQVSMLESKMDAMLVVGCVIDVIFFFDMILQFFIMYPKRINGEYSLEYRHLKIIDHYLKTGFFVDLLSTIPFDLVAALSKKEGVQQLKVAKAVRLMRLLKLVRVAKASRVFNRFEVRMSVTYGKLALLKFFVILFLITHWLANLWALTLVIVDADEGIPRWVDVFDDQEANVEVKTRDSPGKLYVACLYFTSYTITSVGFGDIGPRNIVERVVLTFILMVSGVSWAVVLGQVSGVVTHLDREEQSFRSMMDELNSMLHDRLISASMRTRLRSFFLSSKTAHKRGRHLHIVSAMSPGLRAEVSWELNRFWLDKITFLRPLVEEAKEHPNSGINRSLRDFVLDVALIMDQINRAQHEVFGVPHTLYILTRGLVGRLDRVFGLGSVWCSDFVLSDRRLLEPAQRMALTYVETMCLSRQNFFDIVQRHCTNFPEIQRTVRRHCCWLAFQRALLLEARRRRGL